MTTSWISSSAADFAKAGADQNRRAEASANEVVINRSSAPIIHQHGNRAYVELPTESNHWITVNGEPAIWTSYMRLIYRCEKRGGVWKIADMTSVFESDKLTPVIPGTDLHIQPQDVVEFRPSYRWMSYTRTRAGGKVNPDLLGIDRPDEVDTLYAQAEAWIADTK